MVALEGNMVLEEVWIKESKTTPTFEECLRLLAMYEFPACKTTVYPIDAVLVISRHITFTQSKQATLRAMKTWRNQASSALCDAFYADWKEANLIVIIPK